MGKRAHVTGTLNIILSAQWIDANAFPSDISGEHS